MSNFKAVGQLRLYELRDWKQLHKLQNQLAFCTKNPAFSCKNFVILPIVKTLDKIKIL